MADCYFFTKYTTGRKDDTLKTRCIVELDGYCVSHVNRYDRKDKSESVYNINAESYIQRSIRA